MFQNKPWKTLIFVLSDAKMSEEQQSILPYPEATKLARPSFNKQVGPFYSVYYNKCDLNTRFAPFFGLRRLRMRTPFRCH